MNDAEVRELIRKYGDEPPEAPQCQRCKKPMYVDGMTSNGCEFGCRCGHATRVKRERDFDAEVVTLAQDYLRLKAAVRIQHNSDVTAKSDELAEAQLLLKQVAKEPPCP